MALMLKDNLVKAHDLYFKPFITKEQIAERIKLVGQQLSSDYKDKIPLFISILNGAYIFASDLTRAYSGDCEIAFVKLSSYSGLQSTGEVQELIGLNIDIQDRHVIVVEDIIDTGNTLSKFLKTLENLQPASVELASLLLKPDALKYPLDVKYLCFEIENKFVIGYGLDYNELGRNLPDIYQLSEGPSE